MGTSRIKRFLSYVLIGGGAFLLFQGARDFLESRWGQSAAERQFENAGPLDGTPAGPDRPRDGETVAKLCVALGMAPDVCVKRGDTWWYEFVFSGERIRESTKQGNKRVAEQMAAARQRERPAQSGHATID